MSIRSKPPRVSIPRPVLCDWRLYKVAVSTQQSAVSKKQLNRRGREGRKGKLEAPVYRIADHRGSTTLPGNLLSFVPKSLRSLRPLRWSSH